MRYAALAALLLLPRPSHAQAKGTGSATDLSGAWSSPTHKTRLVFHHVGGGNHQVSGRVGNAAVSGTATIADHLGTPDEPVRLLLDGTQSWATVSRERTAMGWKGRTLYREVPKGLVRVRAMAYNIEGRGLEDYELLKETARFINRQRPDVVVLGECKTFQLLGLTLVNEAEIIAKEGGYDWAWGSDRRDGTGGEGEAVLVRRASPLRPHIIHHHSYWIPSGGGSRQALATDVVLHPKGRIRVIGTHFGLSPSGRLRSSQIVLGLVRTPGFVLGDLNAPPREDSMRLLRTRLLDGFATANPADPGFTFPSYKPEVRIDYAYVAPGRGGRVLSSWVVPETGHLVTGERDDHRPVMVVADVLAR